MPMNLDSVGVVSAPGQRSWTSKDALLYALGVGAGQTDPTGSELEFTTENSQNTPQRVLPTFPVIIGMGAGAMPSFGEINWAMLVHGEQSIEVFGEIPPEGTVESVTQVVGIYDKGSGALAVMETESKYVDSGKPAFKVRMGAFIRGEGGFGDSRGPELPARVKAPEKAPDKEVTYATRDDQALLYRLSGDRNPLHSDPAFAALAGFPKPILHGLCTYGVTGRALLARALRLRSGALQGHGRAVQQAGDAGRRAHRAHVARRRRHRDLPDRHPGRHRRHRQRQVHALVDRAKPVLGRNQSGRRGLSATAAAPMMGPSAPRPPGTMRVPREKSRRHERSSSACAAAKNGAPKPSATEPDVTASGRSSRLATDATARPTRRPQRSIVSGDASSGRASGDRTNRGARRLGLRAALARRSRTRGRRARRSRGRRGPRCRRRRRGGGRRERCRRRCRSTRPSRGSSASRPRRRASLRRARAPWRRCRGRSEGPCGRGAGRATGSRATPGMLTGDTSALPAHRSSAPDATCGRAGAVLALASESTTVASVANSTSASVVAGVAARARRRSHRARRRSRPPSWCRRCRLPRLSSWSCTHALHRLFVSGHCCGVRSGGGANPTLVACR